MFLGAMICVIMITAAPYKISSSLPINSILPRVHMDMRLIEWFLAHTLEYALVYYDIFSGRRVSVWARMRCKFVHYTTCVYQHVSN